MLSGNEADPGSFAPGGTSNRSFAPSSPPRPPPSPAPLPPRRLLCSRIPMPTSCAWLRNTGVLEDPKIPARTPDGLLAQLRMMEDDIRRQLARSGAEDSFDNLVEDLEAMVGAGSATVA